MYGTDLLVSSYVVIRHGCPIAISVDSPEQAQITCGRLPSDAFEFIVHREALRALAELALDALEQMDAAVA